MGPDSCLSSVWGTEDWSSVSGPVVEANQRATVGDATPDSVPDSAVVAMADRNQRATDSSLVEETWASCWAVESAAAAVAVVAGGCNSSCGC